MYGYPDFYNYRQEKHLQKYTVIWALIVIALAFGIFILYSCTRQDPVWAAEITPPENLYMGLIAEDCSGDYQTYLVIASVVHNRLDAGMNNGLVALKRQNLEQFIKQNCDYMLKTKGIDLTKLATKAIAEVFEKNRDYVNGATYYEHTRIYGVPKFWKNLRIVGKIYPNTKKEITLAKGR